MATDNKNNKETAVKPGKDPVVEKPEKVEVTPGNETPAEGLQSGAIEAPVVVTPTAEQMELERIDQILRSAYEGKGTISEDMPVDFEQSLIGKSEAEIIEAVKPYFNFADGSQSDPETKETILADKDTQEIDLAKGLVNAIKELTVEDLDGFTSKAKELMDTQNLKEIWRCPTKGYWFSRKDYAENYQRENECSLEHYKK